MLQEIFQELQKKLQLFKQLLIVDKKIQLKVFTPNVKKNLKFYLYIDLL
mgnify:CR=1 FL=1|jgi:hypothetical protein